MNGLCGGPVPLAGGSGLLALPSRCLRAKLPSMLTHSALGNVQKMPLFTCSRRLLADMPFHPGACVSVSTPNKSARGAESVDLKADFEPGSSLCVEPTFYTMAGSAWPDRLLNMAGRPSTRDGLVLKATCAPPRRGGTSFISWTLIGSLNAFY